MNVELSWVVYTDDGDFECGSIEVDESMLDDRAELRREVIGDFEERSMMFDDYADGEIVRVVVARPGFDEEIEI